MKTWRQFIRILAIITFLFNFSTCDFLNDDNEKDNSNTPCTHTWVWTVTISPTEDDDGLRTERCSKCNASGRTQTISAGTELDAEPPDNDEDLLPEETNSNAIVEPLVKTKWGQYSPFNNMLPLGDYGSYSRRTGCMATAMAQIMNYHKHPVQGSGQSEPYITSIGLNVPSINYETDYDWENMPIHRNNATEIQRNAVAKLMFHVGVSVEMNYGRSGSSSGRFLKALPTHFGYDKSIELINRKNYDDAAWEAILREQLDDDLPVYYWARFPGGNGHAFVVDGYDSTGKFHFNCGWNGKDDGYYSINSIIPQTYTFGDDHTIIINIKPDKGGSTPDYRISLEHFSAQKISVVQNEMLEVYTFMRNVNNSSTRFLGGQVGAALVDDNNDIVTVIGMNTMGEGSYWSRLEDRPINCIVPETVPLGQYQLRIVTRPTGGEWRIAILSLPGVPSSIPITVTEGEPNGGGYGQTLTVFSTNKTIVSQNESFAVTVQTRNISPDVFPGGQVGAALVNNDGNIVAVIGTANTGLRNPGTLAAARDINCKVPNTVDPGQYRLRIVIRPTGGEWKIATLSNDGVPTSINFMLE